jgi:uncharacterized protein
LFTLKWLNSLTVVTASQWDALFAAEPAAAGYPFCRHGFLLALEQGGSVGAATGWQSQHLTLWQDETLIAAMPGYLKRHSYGEYLFDWQIAEAHHQFNLPYYPKWIAAIPFTPTFGPRLGVLPEFLEQALNVICAALQQQINTKRLYTVQWLYISNALQKSLVQYGYLPRHDVQFLWHNKAYTSFDAFINQLTSRKRKQIRQERASTAGYTLVTLEGSELKSQHWQSIVRCYQATYLKRSGHHGYITAQSFLQLGQSMAEQLVVFAALSDAAEIQAMALCFKSNDTLYGRYWGALVASDKLHFELCYYQGIEYCITHGLTYFDAGAQGEHKLKRGFEPVMRYGCMLMAPNLLTDAISRFCLDERAALEQYIAAAKLNLPFAPTHVEH